MFHKRLTSLGLGFLLGVASLAWIAYEAAPKVMILENESALSYEDTVATLKEASKDNGWKIPKVHELDKTMTEAGYQVAPVSVIELCHVQHAARVLGDADSRIVSSMMPCRVSVYVDAEDKVIVSRMNTGAIARVFGGTVAEVMAVASQETELILDSVLKPAS